MEVSDIRNKGNEADYMYKLNADLCYAKPVSVSQPEKLTKEQYK